MKEYQPKNNSFEFISASYKTSKNIARISKLGVAGGLLTQSPNFTIMAIFIAVILDQTSKGIYSDIATCDEYKRFNEIYQFVYSEMKKNINEFNYSSIEEIYTYFLYIVNNGYLNYDCTLEDILYDQRIYCEQAIIEAIALNSHGVCRNLASFLTRFMNDFNHEAKSIACTYHHGIFPEDKIKDIDMPQEAITDDLEKLKYLGNKKLDIIISDYEAKYPKKPKYTGGHMITQANDENFTYYLDSAIPQVYIPIPNRPEEYISPIADSIIISNQHKKDSLKGTNIANEHIQREKKFKDIFEIMYHLAQIEETLSNNSDILEKLHKEIQPSLEEAESIYQKIIVPKKKKIF